MAVSGLFITGASGGLGMPVAEKLLASGFRLHAAVQDERGELQLQQRFPQWFGNMLSTVRADIRTAAGVAEFTGGLRDPSGLVHLAGGFRMAASLGQSPEEDFNWLFDLNVKATFLLLRSIMPGMIASGAGSIVTVAARSVLHPGSSNAAYTASKAGVVSLTLGAAEEGRAHGVRANCILPSVIRTEANLRSMAAMDNSQWIPPEQIADLVVFLMGESSRAVTGSLFPM
jgi:3-oxoacyl-[acyl-carrier protein] reductase